MSTTALRFILLVALLLGLNAWTVTHLGTGLRDFALVNGVLAFVGLALGWIDERDAGELRAIVKAIGPRLISAPILAALYVAALVGTSFVSSVTVIADGYTGSASLRLSAEGNNEGNESPGVQLDGPDGVIRFVRVTNVFGRPLFLEASGFQRKSIILMPWTGTRLSLATDLVKMPTIVLRIPHEVHTSLDGGKVVIEFGQSKGVEIATDSKTASVQLGPPAAISDALRQEWRSELRAARGLTETLMENVFRSWLNPKRDESIPHLPPGQRVRVRFVTSQGFDVAGYDLVVGRDPIQDALLLPGG